MNDEHKLYALDIMSVEALARLMEYKVYHTDEELVRLLNRETVNAIAKKNKRKTYKDIENDIRHLIFKILAQKYLYGINKDVFIESFALEEGYAVSTIERYIARFKKENFHKKKCPYCKTDAFFGENDDQNGETIYYTCKICEKEYSVDYENMFNF